MSIEASRARLPLEQEVWILNTYVNCSLKQDRERTLLRINSIFAEVDLSLKNAGLKPHLEALEKTCKNKGIEIHTLETGTGVNKLVAIEEGDPENVLGQRGRKKLDCLTDDCLKMSIQYLTTKELGKLSIAGRFYRKISDQEKVFRINQGVPVKTLGLTEKALLPLLIREGADITKIDLSELSARKLNDLFKSRGAEGLLDMCPNITSLSLNYCHLMAGDLQALSEHEHAHKVKILSLFWNKIYPEDVNAIISMQGITSLAFDLRKIDATEVAKLGAMPNLTHLTLRKGINTRAMNRSIGSLRNAGIEIAERQGMRVADLVRYTCNN